MTDTWKQLKLTKRSRQKTMRGLQRIGEYFLEFIVVTLISLVAAATVIGFFPITVGLAGFFRRDINNREFKDIFITIGKNWKLILPYSIFQIVIIGFSILNIYFFNTHLENLNGFILAVSYITLIIGCFYMTTAPTVIVNMNVNFFQLLVNGIMLLFGGFLNSLVSIICVAGVVYLILNYPIIALATLYAFPFITDKLMLENLYRLKAKALKTTVYELKKQEKEDDYLDEYGNIKRTQSDVENINGEKNDEKR